MKAEFWGDVFVGIHMTTEPLHEAYDTGKVYEHEQGQKIKCWAVMLLLQYNEYTAMGP